MLSVMSTSFALIVKECLDGDETNFSFFYLCKCWRGAEWEPRGRRRGRPPHRTETSSLDAGSCFFFRFPSAVSSVLDFKSLSRHYRRLLRWSLMEAFGGNLLVAGGDPFTARRLQNLKRTFEPWDFILPTFFFLYTSFCTKFECWPFLC